MPRLEEVFARVSPSLHFNIELKFPADDSVDVSDADVAHMLDHVVPVSFPPCSRPALPTWPMYSLSCIHKVRYGISKCIAF